jgi:outer membrane protein OmpA-like peptidoglycan-associated protein
MKTGRLNFQLSALAFILCFASASFAQINSMRARQISMNSVRARNVPDGQELKITGIVVKRNADSFTLREADGAETVVNLTDRTNVKTDRKGLFRSDKQAGVSYILRGLRLKVEGRGNSEGQLVATKIRFTEQDLMTAQALETRVDPVETMATDTKALAEANQQRITEAEQNAQKLSGQIDELAAIAAANREATKVAQSSADRAQSDANFANARINGLDDYDVVDTFMVHFRSGSAELTDLAKEQIDAAAAKVKSENLKGWIVEVVGFADATGKSARNRSLSERRAQAVINYLVTKYNLPLRRLVQPFGYGELNPVADNETGQGRSLNRRVEIKVLVNKSVTAQAGN